MKKDLDELDVDSILEEASKIKPKKNKSKKSDTVDTNNSISQKGRKFEEKVLQYKVNDDDPELVVYIKDLINESNITNTQVYNKFGKKLGWNMMYALETRNQIAWDRFTKWADLIGYEVEIQLIPKKKKK